PAIADRHSDLELVLYGSAQVTPEHETEFNGLVGSTAHAARIRRTGHIDDADLADLFAGCALFVFPTTVEGFGYPLLEAMYHGACCITRNASAMKEVGGDAVCLVETLNPDEIAGAANALLNEPARRAELGARAAARARRFTIEEMVGKTVECYRAVL
ncbi:MAG TPA: glycosyltransferase, partial [Vicinamibacterales bacterium]